MDQKICSAVEQLGSYITGDRLLVTDHTSGSHVYEMTVTRPLHRCDGAFGSYESSRISAQIRIAGYAREITAEQIASGQVEVSVSTGEDQP